MSRSSYRHSDYLGRENKARPHVRVGTPADNTWQARFDRNADAEAPAGGASASVSDLARFLRLQLARGRFDGTPVVEAAALAVTHEPQPISAPRRARRREGTSMASAGTSRTTSAAASASATRARSISGRAPPSR